MEVSVMKFRLKKIFLLTLLSSIVLCGCSTEKEKENIDNNIDKEPIVEELKEKRMSLVAVGDVLIHGALYYEADKMNGQLYDDLYDFNYMFTEINPFLENYSFFLPFVPSFPLLSLTFSSFLGIIYATEVCNYD